MSNAGNACNSSHHATAYNSSCFFSGLDDADDVVFVDDENVDGVDDEDSSTTIVDVTVAVVVLVLSSSSSISSTSIYTSGVGTALDTLSFVFAVAFAVVDFVVFCFDESIIIFRNAD